jgi:hypothetical protein
MIKTYGTKCYHLHWNFIIWDEMLSSGITWSLCYHLELILSTGANVIIWCYHVMLSFGMITPYFKFSWKLHSLSFNPTSSTYMAKQIQTKQNYRKHCHTPGGNVKKKFLLKISCDLFAYRVRLAVRSCWWMLPDNKKRKSLGFFESCARNWYEKKENLAVTVLWEAIFQAIVNLEMLT